MERGKVTIWFDLYEGKKIDEKTGRKYEEKMSEETSKNKEIEGEDFLERNE